MSLLLLLRRVTKVFRPSKPVRGTSVQTSPENVFVMTPPTTGGEVLATGSETALMRSENQLFIVQRRK